MSEPQPGLPRLLRIVREPSASLTHHDAARRVNAGELERVRPGVVRPVPVPLEAMDRFERHEERRKRYVDRVAAVATTRKSAAVFAGRSALAIWDYAVTDDWPPDVELLEQPGSARRSKRGVVVHRNPFDAEDVVPWGDRFVTSPARTLADLARAGDFAAAVIALDHALSDRVDAARRVTKEEIAEILERASGRGLARAQQVLEFADGRSGSGGESLSRVGIHLMGFEPPERQVRHPHPGGYYDSDFWWPPTRFRPPTIGEFDGIMKYLREDMRGGADASQIVVVEKLREDFLRGEGNGFTRWGWREARTPVRLLRPLLLRAGIRIVRRPLI